MAIYTKAGDKGSTKVFDKKTRELVKISKTSKKIRAIGTLDELNSFLGIIKSRGIEPKIVSEIQKNLFTINAIIAGTPLGFSKTKIKRLEKQIDKWEGTLPVLKNFIFYGGEGGAAEIFYARALTRKAERALVLYSKIEPTKDVILAYMNRLSDFLFMMARYTNVSLNQKEEVWTTKKK